MLKELIFGGVMFGSFLGIWISLMTSCHRDSGDLEKARTLALHGKDDAAIILYEKIIAENPESLQAKDAVEELQKMYENYATTMDKSDLQTAIRLNKKIIERWPGSKVALRATSRLKEQEEKSLSESPPPSSSPVQLPVPEEVLKAESQSSQSEEQAKLPLPEPASPTPAPVASTPSSNEPCYEWKAQRNLDKLKSFAKSNTDSPCISVIEARLRKKSLDSKESREIRKVFSSCETLSDQCLTFEQRFNVLRKQSQHQEYFLSTYFQIIQNALIRVEELQSEGKEILSGFDRATYDLSPWLISLQQKCFQLCQVNRVHFDDLTLCKSAVDGKSSWEQYFQKYENGACGLQKKAKTVSIDSP